MFGNSKGFYETRPEAGRRSSLHSSRDGLNPPSQHKKPQPPTRATHDYTHILGWNRRG